MKVPLPVPTTDPGGDEDGAGVVGEEEEVDVEVTVNTFNSEMLDFRSMLPVSVWASLVVVVVVPTLATNTFFGDVEIIEVIGLEVVAGPVVGDRQGETIDKGGPKWSDLTSEVTKSEKINEVNEDDT